LITALSQDRREKRKGSSTIDFEEVNVKAFEYHIPKSLDEALTLFKSLKNPMYVAGGTDVIVNIKRKKISPENLISLRNIDPLKAIEKGDVLRIGSCVTHEDILRNREIERYYSALYDATSKIGSKQIRNVATIGGNICNAAPSADTACPLLVFDAIVRIYGESGERSVPLDDFFVGPGLVSKKENEIVTCFELPIFSPYTGSAYIKHSRREAMDLAMVSVATRLTFSVGKDLENLKIELRERDLGKLEEEISLHDLEIREVRIAMGVVAPRPKRAKEAEAYLTGKVLNRETIRRATEIAMDEAHPRDTIRGEAWYRKEMVRVLTRRAILLSVIRGIESQS
jgi:carbon-monoxide dehydrogenase medium subunit